jgi:heme-degrading monooxygenase HmoA
MIERHVTFEVLPEKGTEFEQYFMVSYRPAMSKMPGFMRVELIRDVKESNCYQMVIRFQSVEESDAWRNSPEHKSLSPRLKSLYGESKVEIYEVIA